MPLTSSAETKPSDWDWAYKSRRGLTNSTEPTKPTKPDTPRVVSRISQFAYLANERVVENVSQQMERYGLSGDPGVENPFP